MRFQKFLAALTVFCMLLLTGCSQKEITAFAEQVEGMFENVCEAFSVRSLEKSNQTLTEPEYISWQTARHYYADLSEKEKLAYRCIYNGIFGQPERIAVPLLNTQELNDVFDALRYDNPQLLFLGDEARLLTAGMYCYFVPEYSMFYWEARNMLQDAVAKAREAFALCPQNADDYSVLLTLHDYLCSFCAYANGISAAECHGALLDGYAICSGYAKALKLMLDVAGLDSCLVTGNASDNGTNSNHMWLAVSLNGAWVFCDPTWDDPVSEDGLQTVEHGYFAVSEQRLLLTHSNIQMPSHIVCDTEDYDYFLVENLFCDQDNYLTVITDGLQSALQDGKPVAEFRFDSAASLQDAIEELLDEGGVYTLLYEIAYLREGLQTDRIGYAADEERLQLKLIFVFDE